MLLFLIRILEILAAVWLLRFLWKVFSGKQSATTVPRSSNSTPVAGELKKDPQCGTYVSAEVSLKTRYGNEELHFCSRECQQEFLRAHRETSA